MRILVLTPWVPYPVTGACQQDRFNGFLQLQRLGHEVRVIARIHGFQDRPAVEAAFAQAGIPLVLVPHGNPWKILPRHLLRAVREPAYLDGAALDSLDPAFEARVRSEVETFKPDAAWIEYTHQWPVLRLLKPYGIPTVMKSSLNEPRNCKDENGHSLASVIKSWPKYGGETIAARESDVILGITPVEEEWYRSRGAVHTGTLPLRGLASCLVRHAHTEKAVLDVVFLSSNFNMGHNRDALRFLLEEVVPLARQRAPGRFRFHITGKKFPKAWEGSLAEDVLSTGFLPDLGAFLAGMDIALCPWISGQGMQQKVFEPLCRGLPLITHKTAGYPFEDGKEVLLRQDAGGYVDALLELTETKRRQQIADAAYEKSKTLFSEDVLMKIQQDALERAVATHRQ